MSGTLEIDWAEAIGDTCVACRKPFVEGETRVLIIYAGAAWQNGVAIGEDNAELFRVSTFHDYDAPPAGLGRSPERREPPSA